VLQRRLWGEPEVERQCGREMRSRDRNAAQRDRMAVDQDAQVRLAVAEVEDQPRHVGQAQEPGQVGERRALALDDARLELHAPAGRQVLLDVGARGQCDQHVGLVRAREHLLVADDHARQGDGQLLVDLVGDRGGDALGSREREAQVALSESLGRDRGDQHLGREPAALQPQLDRRLDLLGGCALRKRQLGEAGEGRLAQARGDLRQLQREAAEVQSHHAPLEHQQPSS